MFKKIEIFLFLILIPVSFVFGQIFPNVQESFEEVESLYQKGDYQGAISIYEEILEGGTTSAPLYYNLGNAYFKSGDIGRAVLNYERAYKISPEDKALKHNLSFVRDLLQDKLSVQESSRWAQRLIRLHRFLSLNGVVGAGSVCYILFLLFASYAIVRPQFRPTFFRVLFFPLLGFLVLFLAVGAVKMLEPQFSPAIVIAKELDVHYGPSIHETKAFVLHAGTKCSIRDLSGEWALIWLPNDKGGWVQQSGLERI